MYKLHEAGRPMKDIDVTLGGFDLYKLGVLKNRFSADNPKLSRAVGKTIDSLNAATGWVFTNAGKGAEVLMRIYLGDVAVDLGKKWTADKMKPVGEKFNYWLQGFCPEQLAGMDAIAKTFDAIGYGKLAGGLGKAGISLGKNAISLGAVGVNNMRNVLRSAVPEPMLKPAFARVNGKIGNQMRQAYDPNIVGPLSFFAGHFDDPIKRAGGVTSTPSSILKPNSILAKTPGDLTAPQVGKLSGKVDDVVKTAKPSAAPKPVLNKGAGAAAVASKAADDVIPHKVPGAKVKSPSVAAGKALADETPDVNIKASVASAAEIKARIAQLYETGILKPFKRFKLDKHQKGVEFSHIVELHVPSKKGDIEVIRVYLSGRRKEILKVRPDFNDPLSAFLDLEIAEKSIATAIRQEALEIDKWFKSATIGKTKELELELGKVIGYIQEPGENTLKLATNIRIVIKKTNAKNIKIVTSFPIKS